MEQAANNSSNLTTSLSICLASQVKGPSTLPSSFLTKNGTLHHQDDLTVIKGPPELQALPLAPIETVPKHSQDGYLGNLINHITNYTYPGSAHNAMLSSIVPAQGATAITSLSAHSSTFTNISEPLWWSKVSAYTAVPFYGQCTFYYEFSQSSYTKLGAHNWLDKGTCMTSAYYDYGDCYYATWLNSFSTGLFWNNMKLNNFRRPFIQLRVTLYQSN